MDERGTAADRDDWDSHWRGYSEAAAHNPAQEYRRRLILEILANTRAAPSRLLDIGAGTGDLSLELRRAFPEADVLGVDVSHEGIEIARSKVPGAEFVQRDLLESGADPADQGWATHAVCSEVLEHVDDPGRLLHNARSYLEEGAQLVVTVPGGPMSHFDRHIGHRRHYTAAELRDLLEASGFEVEAASGAGFPFFNLYRLIVILRGRQLIQDIEDSPSVFARAIMRLFGLLFRLNVRSSPWGWQTVASARVNESQLV